MPIRVLLSQLPPLIREIVARAIAGVPDIELVGVCDDAGALAGVLAAARPDVVIVPSAPGGAARAHRALVAGCPGVRLLEIGEQGLDLFELRLLARDPNVGAVLGSIRSVAARPS